MIPFSFLAIALCPAALVTTISRTTPRGRATLICVPILYRCIFDVFLPKTFIAKFYIAAFVVLLHLLFF